MGKKRRAMYVQLNIKAHSRYHCCSGKTVSITYFECVSVASVIQHPKRTRHIIRPIFLHIISQLARFRRKKKSMNIKRVFLFSLQLLSEIFLIPRRIQLDITINIHMY